MHHQEREFENSESEGNETHPSGRGPLVDMVEDKVEGAEREPNKSRELHENLKFGRTVNEKIVRKLQVEND